MKLGIRPTVDFVFKFLFGTVSNRALLIDLLNSVLLPKSPIVDVVLLNPFSEKTFRRKKGSVADIKVCDQLGNWYVIEVQTYQSSGFRNRLTFYTSGLYHGQLQAGDPYTTLRSATVVCFLTKRLFPEIAAGDLHFELYDRQHQVHWGDHLQVHTIELPKYDLDEVSIRRASRREQWIFFLNRADRFNAATLRKLLPDRIFQQAIGVLEMVSRSPKLRMIYDDQAKAELDRMSLIKETREEGRLEGRVEGVAQGRAEGEARGELIGRVRVWQQLLGQQISTDEQLHSMSAPDLAKMAERLERQWNRR